MLDFTPSEVIFYENDAKTFLVFDKEDPDRKVNKNDARTESSAALTRVICSVQLYYTTDFGESFDMLQSNVKSMIWSSGDDLPTHLYVERKEPTSKFIFGR